MPAEVLQPATPAVAVRPSIVSEFGFCLFVLQRSCDSPDNWNQHWVRDLQEHHEELVERASGFWGDGFPEWSELLLLADWSGHLWDDGLEPFLDELPAVAKKKHVVPPLPSEGREVPPILQARIDRLAKDTAFRERYVQVLRQTWAIIKPAWEGGGRREAERQAEDLRRRIARTSDFRSILPANHFARREMHQALVDRAVQRGEVVVVPLALAGVGVGFFSLPGTLIVSLGPEAGSHERHNRERAERVAAKLKVLSDPTRVSILRSVIGYPYSITDLAQVYDLSQPTVSVHVKLLREAGLLDSYKEDGHTMYRSTREKVREFAGSAVDELLG